MLASRSHKLCSLSGYVIHAAVVLHLPEIITALLRMPSMASSFVDERGCTPLHHAECYACMELLLKSNHFDTNAVNEAGETPLHRLVELATRTPLSNLVRIGPGSLESLLMKMQKDEVPCKSQPGLLDQRALLLIEHKANIEVQDHKGRTPLHILPVYAPELVRCLASSKTVDAVDHQRRVPLTLLLQLFALGRGSIAQLMEIFWILMDQDPNINIADDAGCTPLHHAVSLVNLPTDAFVRLRDAREGRSAALVKNKKLQTPLHLAAISDCSIDIFRNLLEVSGKVIHEVDFTGRMALHYACQFHSPDKVSLLLSQGSYIDIPVCDADQRTPLHYAAKYHASEQVLTSLIKHSPSMCHILDHLGRTPFDYAVGRAVTVMVKHEPSLLHVTNTAATMLRRTPLHVACDWPTNSGSRFKASRIARIHLLLSQGDKKRNQAVDQNGQTAIHLAVISHIPARVLRSLLDAASETSVIHTTDHLGRTALHYACIPKTSKHSLSLSADDRVLTLLTRGANRDIGTQDIYLRQTPIHVATICASSATLQKLLEALNLVGSIHNVDVTGRTALHYACDPRTWSLEKVKMLLMHGAARDIVVRDHKMQTPLHLAAMLHGWEVLETLLEANTTTVFLDSKGRSPLHYACMHWTPGVTQKMISLLLGHGAGICSGIPDKPTGRTPIHLATISGTPSMYLEMLALSQPSAIDVADHFGRTSLHYACHGRLGSSLDSDERAERVSVLLKHGAQQHIYLPDKKGQIPFGIAATTGASEKVLDILTHSGEDKRWERKRNNVRYRSGFKGKCGNTELYTDVLHSHRR